MRVIGFKLVSATAACGVVLAALNGSALAQTTTFNAVNSKSPYGMPLTFDVTQSGDYEITATGASGGNSIQAAGGLGAEASGEFNLSSGTILTLYVGSAGANSSQFGGGGGGGSFVVTGTTVLLAGGGGGGAYGFNGLPGGTTQDTGSGLGGQGGFFSGSGGGVNGNGSAQQPGCAGQGLTTGSPALGGGVCTGNASGGYGGGGGGVGVGAGGGGYSGGGAGGYEDSGDGGTSYVDMNTSDGYVTGSAGFVLASSPGDGTITITGLSATTPIPEPTSLALFGGAVAMVAGLRRRPQPLSQQAQDQ